MNRTLKIMGIMAIAAVIAIALPWSLSEPGESDSTGRIELPESATGSELETDRYAAVLSNYVNDDGMVNYAGLKANPDDLNAYLASIANLDQKVFDQWPESERIVTWCNAYNAYTLKAIIDHYPIESSFFKRLSQPKNSIRQIAGVWDTLRWPVMGDQVTLDMIEHDTLRVEFDEPRIHAALVCAAMSCPPLRNEPFTGERLNDQLNDQMRNYLADSNRFRIDRTENIVYLSSILKWYGEDFVKSYGVDDAFSSHGSVERAVLNAVSPHVSDADAEYLRNGEYTVRYLDYDWSLNEQ